MTRAVAVVVILAAFSGCDTGAPGVSLNGDAGPRDGGPLPIDAGAPVCTTASAPDCPAFFASECAPAGDHAWSRPWPEAPFCEYGGRAVVPPTCAGPGAAPACDGPGVTPRCLPVDLDLACP